MRSSILVIVLMLMAVTGWSQRYFTRTGKVSFLSDAPLEKIEGLNEQASCVMDKSNGEIAFSIQMRGFKFEKALMEEHFNENYVESQKYPKSTFKGNIENFSTLDFSKDGKHDVEVSGDLTMHGKTNPVKAVGVIEISKNTIQISSDFTILIDDYDIKIPNAVMGKIADEVAISVEMALEEYSK